MTEVYRAGAGFQGTDEYAPPGADDSLVAEDLPAACLVEAPTAKLGAAESDSDAGSAPVWKAAQGSCEAIFAASSSQPQHLRITAVATHAGFLILRLRSYPAWQVEVNGQHCLQLAPPQ